MCREKFGSANRMPKGKFVFQIFILVNAFGEYYYRTVVVRCKETKFIIVISRHVDICMGDDDGGDLSVDIYNLVLTNFSLHFTKLKFWASFTIFINKMLVVNLI